MSQPTQILCLIFYCTLIFHSCSAAATDAEAEFKRALNIIEKTQLEIFTDTAPETVDEILKRFNTLTAPDRLQDSTAQAISTSSPDQKRIQIMRTLLSETIDRYDDQYANYISPGELKKYKERRSGSYQGVGLKFRTRENNYPLVIGPIIDGPLHNSMLLPGDEIIEANSKDLKSLSSRQIIKILKGPASSQVHLKIKRDNKFHDIHTKRGPVDLHYVRSETIANDIGYIQISRFGGNTHKQFKKHLKALLKNKVRALVLDLRHNPGGSTKAARAIVSMFIKEKDIYCEKNKSGAIKKLPRHGQHITDLPLAVLVNGESISASEIVAGALQSYGRATIVGSPTFGKGLVQRVFNLKEPLGGAIRTTIAVFGTPDHQTIQGAGIVPDIYIETPADFMFRRTGSLNIKDDARALQRTLLEKSVRKKHPDKADALINARDQQLLTAIEKLSLSGNKPDVTKLNGNAGNN